MTFREIRRKYHVIKSNLVSCSSSWLLYSKQPPCLGLTDKGADSTVAPSFGFTVYFESSMFEWDGDQLTYDQTDNSERNKITGDAARWSIT